MLLAYFIAAAFAAATSYGAADFRERPYWRRWCVAKLRFALGFLAILSALAGAVVTAVALTLKWRWDGHGFGYTLLDGLTYGVATVVLLKVPLEGPGLEAGVAVRGLHRIFVSRLGPFLNRGANRNVRRAVGDLKPDALCELSLELFLRHQAGRLRPDVRVEALERLILCHAMARTRPNAEDTLQSTAIATMNGVLRRQCVVLITNATDYEVELPKLSGPSGGRRA